MPLRDHLQSFGLFLPNKRDIVWLFSEMEELRRLYPIVDAALRQRPAYKLVIAAPRHQVLDIRRRLPHEKIVALTLKSQRIRATRYSGSALQILGGKYHHFSDALPHSLRVDETFDTQSVLRLLPLVAFSKQRPNQSSFELAFVRVIAGSPISRLEDLALRLNNPDHILCLGNGPSSEDSRLEGTRYDCLFRVNWIWRDRGLHLNPSMVFTADADLPFGSPRPIMAIPSRAQGLAIIRRHCLMICPPRRGYLFVDELLPPSKVLHESLVPSNGAIMIAVAAALRPKRITIAGIDLYSHDQGRYPGDKDAVDGYSRDHSRLEDLKFIRMALKPYRGELDILSKGLVAELSKDES